MPGTYITKMTTHDSRVTAYEAARPGYPPAVLATLQDRFGLRPGHIVADIGSGSGKLTRLFLPAGYTVYAVEPGPLMRAVAEEILGHWPTFYSVSGRAESTGLPDSSVDWIVVGQAAHWFDLRPARREFERILRPGGGIALVWNTTDERQASTAALQEVLKAHQGPAPPQRRPNRDEANRQVLLGPGYEAFRFEQTQQLDRPTLRQLALSRSYSPQEGEANYGELLEALDALFDDQAAAGVFEVQYTVDLFVSGNPHFFSDHQ